MGEADKKFTETAEDVLESCTEIYRRSVGALNLACDAASHAGDYASDTARRLSASVGSLAGSSPPVVLDVAGRARRTSIAMGEAASYTARRASIQVSQIDKENVLQTCSDIYE